MPQTIEGGISYNIVYDDLIIDPTSSLLQYSLFRNQYGNLYNFTTNALYSNINSNIQYNQCYIDEFTFSVTQSDPIDINVKIKALQYQYLPLYPMSLSPSRIAVWSDAFVTLQTPDFLIESVYFRHFNINIKNNLEYQYTSNNANILLPSAVLA
jgi:hypothetical protein